MHSIAGKKHSKQQSVNPMPALMFHKISFLDGVRCLGQWWHDWTWEITSKCSLHLLWKIMAMHNKIMHVLTFLICKGRCCGCSWSNSACGERSSQTATLYGGGDSTKYDGGGTGGWYGFSKQINSYGQIFCTSYSYGLNFLKLVKHNSTHWHHKAN